MNPDAQLAAMEETVAGMVAAFAALLDLDKERTQTIARIVATLKLQHDTIDRLARGAAV